MSAQDTFNRETEAFNRHDAAAFASGYAPTAVVHDPQYPEPMKGTEAIRKDISDFFTAFPDLEGRATNTIISGDSYAIEWLVTGTHKGPLPGPTGETIPATNKKVVMRAAAIGRLDGQGRIAEERRYYDLAGLLGQLGLSG